MLYDLNWRYTAFIFASCYVSKNIKRRMGDMDEEIDLGTNQKGNDTLLYHAVYHGYRYNLHKSNKNGTSLWRCHKRLICSASATMDATRKKILRETWHECEPDHSNNEPGKVIPMLKTAVCSDLGPVQRIFEDTTADIPPLPLNQSRNLSLLGTPSTEHERNI